MSTGAGGTISREIVISVKLQPHEGNAAVLAGIKKGVHDAASGTVGTAGGGAAQKAGRRPAGAPAGTPANASNPFEPSAAYRERQRRLVSGTMRNDDSQAIAMRLAEQKRVAASKANETIYSNPLGNFPTFGKKQPDKIAFPDDSNSHVKAFRRHDRERKETDRLNREAESRLEKQAQVEASRKLAEQKRVETYNNRMAKAEERERSTAERKQRTDQTRVQNLGMQRSGNMRGAAMAGMGAASGALDLLKNISILSATSEKDLEKLARKWVQLTAAFEAGKGAITIVMNLTKALDMLRKAQMAQKAVEVLTGKGGGKSGVAGTVVDIATTALTSAGGAGLLKGGKAIAKGGIRGMLGRVAAGVGGKGIAGAAIGKGAVAFGGAALAGGLVGGELLSRRFSSDGKGTLETGSEWLPTAVREGGVGDAYRQVGNLIPGNAGAAFGYFGGKLGDLTGKGRKGELEEEKQRMLSPEGREERLRDRDSRTNLEYDLRDRAFSDRSSAAMERNSMFSPKGEQAANSVFAQRELSSALSLQKEASVNPGGDLGSNMVAQQRAAEGVARARQMVLEAEKQGLQIAQQNLSKQKEITSDLKDRLKAEQSRVQSAGAALARLDPMQRQEATSLIKKVNEGTATPGEVKRLEGIGFSNEQGQGIQFNSLTDEEKGAIAAFEGDKSKKIEAEIQSSEQVEREEAKNIERAKRRTSAAIEEKVGADTTVTQIANKASGANIGLEEAGGELKAFASMLREVMPALDAFKNGVTNTATTIKKEDIGKAANALVGGLAGVADQIEKTIGAEAFEKLRRMSQNRG